MPVGKYKPITAIATQGKVTMSVEDFTRLVKEAGGELSYITSYRLVSKPESPPAAAPKKRGPYKKNGHKKSDKIK